MKVSQLIKESYVQELTDSDVRSFGKELGSNEELDKSITKHHKTMPKGTSYEQAGKNLMKKRTGQIQKHMEDRQKAETGAAVATVASVPLLYGLHKLRQKID